MATSAYRSKTLQLQDDTSVIVKGLTIGRLKKFLAAWEAFGDTKNDEEGFEVFINCSGIALAANFREKFDSLILSDKERDSEDKFKWLSDEYKAYLEEVLDLATIYEILDVAGDIKLNDPKLMEAVTEMSKAMDE